MIDTILFDLEGVIIDSMPIWVMADQEFIAGKGYVFDNEKLQPLLAGKAIEEGVEIMRAHYPFAGSTKDLAQERRAIVKKLFQKQVQFIPGFLDFYKKISSKYKLAIATSLEKQYLSAVDSYLHLSQLFRDHVYSIADVNFVSKPHPDIFLYAAKKLLSEPETCIVIEDAPNGITAARKAGMKALGITTTMPKSKLEGADMIVSAFSEISLEYI